MEQTISDQELNAGLLRVMRRNLPPITLGLAILYAIYTVSHLLLRDRAEGVPLAISAAISAAFYFGLYRYTRSREIAFRLVNPLATLIGALALYNSLLHLYLTGEAFQATNLMLVIVGVAVVVLFWRWLALLVGLAWLGWIVSVVTGPVPDNVEHFSFGMFGATVLGVLLHLMLVRTLRDLERLRIKDGLMIRELDAFSHTVAHDLKHPLTPLVSIAAFLASSWDDVDDATRTSMLRQLEGNSVRMATIIDELMLLAQLDRVVVETGPLDMGAVVAEVRNRLLYMTRRADAQITAPDRWPAARGYAPWVAEVWINYLSNAVKYGGEPPQITLGADDPVGGMVRFWVRDNGAGLSAEDQAALFVPFTQLHRDQLKGHGLGLSIVLRIVTRLGGQVGVKSTPGQGSEFYFTLPAV